MSDNKIADQKAKAVKTLAIMLDYLGLEADLKAEEREGSCTINISSQDAGRIIGRKGQTLESLQLLLNRIMFKGDDECPRISLDIDGYSRNNRSRKVVPGDNGEGETSHREPRRERHERRSRDGERRERRSRRGSGMSEEDLRKQAQDAAKEVKRWGDAVTLMEMNAHDRRIIHITLQDDPELTTESVGEGAMKKVVIALKKND